MSRPGRSIGCRMWTSVNSSGREPGIFRIETLMFCSCLGEPPSTISKPWTASPLRVIDTTEQFSWQNRLPKTSLPPSTS